MIYERRSGVPLLKDLTVNDSWVRKTYVEIAKAGRELARFDFDDSSVILRANQLQENILSSLPQVGAVARPVDEGKVSEVRDFIAEEKSGLIVMRHGIQFVEDEERGRLTGAARKIRLMQSPYNSKDPASAQSLAEVASMGIILMHLGKKMQLPVTILSSANVRAADMGGVMSVVNGFRVEIDDRLTCVNYPTNRSDEELEALLGRDNVGALTWKKEILDSVCGDGTFKTIDSDMRTMIDAHTGTKGLTILITHTPQTNAADVIAGDIPMRMPELGFRVFNGDSSKRFMGNIFAA